VFRQYIRLQLSSSLLQSIMLLMLIMLETQEHQPCLFNR